PAAQRLGPAVPGREVVGHPAVGAPEEGRSAGAGLLGEFAPGGGFKVFARVDAALRELPVMRPRRVGAAAQPDQPVRMEQDDADVRSIEFEVLGHPPGFLAHWRVRAEAGARWNPRWASARDHCGTFSRITG